MRLNCQTCGSDNTQLAHVIYSQGATVHESHTKTTLYSPFGRIFGLTTGHARGQTTTYSESLLAQQFAPPIKKPYKKLVLWGIPAALLLPAPIGTMVFPKSLESIGIVFIFVAISGFVGWMLYQHVKYNRTEWPQLLEHWKHLVVCQRCGHAFDSRTNYGQQPQEIDVTRDAIVAEEEQGSRTAALDTRVAANRD